MMLSLQLPHFPRAARTWLNLILLACLSTLLLLSDDFLQQLFTPGNRAELELSYGVTLWLFSAALWLCNLRLLTAAILLLFALMQLMQLGNISFFGEPLSAIDIQSLINDPTEVRQAAALSMEQHWPVLLCVMLPYSLLLALHLSSGKSCAAAESLGTGVDCRGADVQALSGDLPKPGFIRSQPESQCTTQQPQRVLSLGSEAGFPG